MKPQGTLKYLPTALEERAGSVTFLIGIAEILMGLLGIAVLAVLLALGDSQSQRLDTLQRSIPGYLIWEFFRFGALTLFGGLALVVGRGLTTGWQTARSYASRYAGTALALQVTTVLFELGWVGPALGDRATDIYVIARLVQFVAAVVFAVHAILLVVFLRESESGPLVWDTGHRTPEGGIVVMPADVRRDATAIAAPPRMTEEMRHLLLMRVGLPAIGVLFVGAAVWAGVSLWLRANPIPPENPDTARDPFVTIQPLPDAPTPPVPVQPPRSGFQHPANSLRAFDALGSIRIIALGYTTDGSALVTVGRTGIVRVWGTQDDRPIAELIVPEPLPEGIAGAAIAPDGKTMAVATSNLPPRLFELPTLRELAPLAADPNRVSNRSVCIATDGRIAAADNEGVRIWAADGRLESTSPKTPTGPFIAWSANGRTLAVGGDEIHLFDVNGGIRARQSLRWESGFLTGLTFSPDGDALAAASSTGLVTVWETNGGREKYKLRHPNSVHSVAYAPGGQQLVAGTSLATLNNWSASDGRSIGTRVVFYSNKGTSAAWFGGARAIAFRPDGKEFAVACGGAVAVYPIAALRAD